MITDRAAVIPCLRCREDFTSVDRRANRICPKCAAANLRLGRLDSAKPLSSALAPHWEVGDDW